MRAVAVQRARRAPYRRMTSLREGREEGSSGLESDDDDEGERRNLGEKERISCQRILRSLEEERRGRGGRTECCDRWPPSSDVGESCPSLDEVRREKRSTGADRWRMKKRCSSLAFRRLRVRKEEIVFGQSRH
jgi:hypothetical protein